MLSLECWRQSVFGRLAGYKDVNDAQRLRHDPAMQWIVGGKAASDCAASPSQMGRFETKWRAAEKNLSVLADLSGQWIDRVHEHEQRMIAGAGKMPVPGTHLLFAMRRALARVHVEHDTSRRTAITRV